MKNREGNERISFAEVLTEVLLTGTGTLPCNPDSQKCLAGTTIRSFLLNTPGVSILILPDCS